MGEGDGDDRNMLDRATDKIKDAVTDPGRADGDSVGGDAPGLEAGGIPVGQGAVAGTLDEVEPGGGADSGRDF